MLFFSQKIFIFAPDFHRKKEEEEMKKKKKKCWFVINLVKRFMLFVNFESCVHKQNLSEESLCK